MNFKDKLLKTVPEDLITPTSDLDLQLNRLICTLIGIKNSHTELNPKVMAQQVEEVQVRVRATIYSVATKEFGSS